MDLSHQWIARASLRTVFAYSTMMASYLMVNSIAHANTIGMPLTHFLSWPTQGTVLAVVLLCSASSFLAIRAMAYVSRSRRKVTLDC